MAWWLDQVHVRLSQLLNKLILPFLIIQHATSLLSKGLCTYHVISLGGVEGQGFLDDSDFALKYHKANMYSTLCIVNSGNVPVTFHVLSFEVFCIFEVLIILKVVFIIQLSSFLRSPPFLGSVPASIRDFVSG